MSTAVGARPHDVGAILDDGPWARYWIRMVCLAALSIILDGLDGQLIGFAIPAIV